LSCAVVCARPEQGFVERLLSLGFGPGASARWRAALANGPVWRWPLRYGLAVLLVVVATLLRHLRGTLLPEGLTYITYFPAAMIAALVGGWGSGTLATLLSGACADYFFLEPTGQFGSKNSTDLVGLMLFCLIGLGMTWVAGAVDRTRKQAAEGTRRLASIFACSNDAIVVKTLDGIVTSWNPGAETVYGFSAQEMIGHPIAVTIPPDCLDDFQTMMQQVARGEQVRQHETLRIRKDGETFHVSLSISPLKDETGRIVGASTIARDISEHKRAEQALRDSEDAFRTLANFVPQLVWMCAPDGLSVYFNQRWVEYTGLTLEESYGRGWNTPFHPDDKQAAWDAWNHATATGDIYRVESRLRAADGSYRWFLMRGVPLRDAAGNIVKWFGTCTDVDDVKRAEAKLRQASLYTRSLIEASLDPLVTISREGKITDVNEATEKVTGVRRDQLIGSDFSNYFTDPQEARRGYQEVFAKGFVQDYPLAIRHTSGRVTEVLYNATTFKNERGEIGGVFAAARDITERKQAQKALQGSEERYRSLVTATAQVVWTTNPEGQVEDMPMWRAITGQSQEEVRGAGWLNAVHPEDRERTAMVWAKAVKDRSSYGVEYRVRRNDGEYRHFAVRGVPVLEHDGKIREWIGTCTDITERKRAEQALQTERQRFREVLDRLPVYVVLLTPDYHVALDNTVFRERFGESQGRHCYEFLFGRDAPCEICETYNVLKTNSAHQWKWTGPDGRHYDIFDFPFADSDGSPLILEMGMDITERERAEEEVRRLNDELEQRVIRRTAELEAANKELEAFTYSVSHDLRAPLRHIGGFSKILTEEFNSSLPPEAQHHLQRIEEGTRRMGALVDDLLNLARVGRRDVSLQVTGLKSVVEEVISNLKPEFADRKVEWKIGNLPYVECDTALMKQVFENLLSNALKFTRPRPQALIEIGQSEQDGTSVIHVRDNGVGFSMKYADKLFGVFQRLHRAEDFEGTGVGLATVQRIIQKHGGRIWAEAELDKGGTFYFTLGNSEKNEPKAKAAVVGDKHA
jgi:PAS domain S-box-containing protein